MPSIYLESSVVSVATLQEATQPEDIKAFSTLSPYFQKSLQFCHQWLAGQEFFTITTSGSTGMPKPITISRYQMKSSAQMTNQTLHLHQHDTALVCLNVDYIAGKMMMVRALEAGMNMVIIEPTAHPLAALEHQVNFTALVPLQVQAILESQDSLQIQRLQQLKALLIGGAPVSYPLQQAIASNLHNDVYATYGMTETVSHIALKNLSKQESCFRVLPGVQVHTDQRSCLVIKGAVTNDEQIVTNDVVRLIDDNHFEWIGRADHVINSGGYKVFPERVESAVARILHQQKHDRLFFVSGIADDRLGQQVILVMEGAPLSNAEEKIVQQHIAAELHPYEKPRSIFYLPKFVMTHTGKVKRMANLDLIMKK